LNREEEEAEEEDERMEQQGLLEGDNTAGYKGRNRSRRTTMQVKSDGTKRFCRKVCLSIY
jgi:hypothetical protein